MRILIRLVLNSKFLEIISRCCATLSAIGYISLSCILYSLFMPLISHYFACMHSLSSILFQIFSFIYPLSCILFYVVSFKYFLSCILYCSSGFHAFSFHTYMGLFSYVHRSLWQVSVHMYSESPRSFFITSLSCILYCTMGWLRLVGSLKSQVSFAKESYKRNDILQQRPKKKLWVSVGMYREITFLSYMGLFSCVHGSLLQGSFQMYSESLRVFHCVSFIHSLLQYGGGYDQQAPYNHRSLLQKSPIKETIFCRDYVSFVASLSNILFSYVHGSLCRVLFRCTCIGFFHTFGVPKI